MPTLADFGSPTPFQRFVDDYIDPASCLDKALHDEEKQVPTELQRRPARSIEHLVKPAKVAIQMMARLPQVCHNAAVTVRRPRAKMVPVRRVIIFFQVGAVNNG